MCKCNNFGLSYTGDVLMDLSLRLTAIRPAIKLGFLEAYGCNSNISTHVLRKFHIFEMKYHIRFLLQDDLRKEDHCHFIDKGDNRDIDL